MNRQTYAWDITDGTEVRDSGQRFSHNAALKSGEAAVRQIARSEGQCYSRGQVEKALGVTAVTWLPDRFTDAPLTVRVWGA